MRTAEVTTWVGLHAELHRGVPPVRRASATRYDLGVLVTLYLLTCVHAFIHAFIHAALFVYKLLAHWILHVPPRKAISPQPAQ